MCATPTKPITEKNLIFVVEKTKTALHWICCYSLTICCSITAVLAKNLQWSTGLSAQLQDNYTDPSTGVRRLIPDYLRYKAGAYWVGEYIPSNDFSAEVGLRFDYDHIDTQKYYRIAVWNDRGYDAEYSSTIIRTTNASNYLTRHIKNFGNLSASTGLKQRFGKSTVALFNLGYITVPLTLQSCSATGFITL